jgi:hypothetical protein
MPGPRADAAQVLAETTIVNEFTGVRVRKLLTRNGERLEVESMRLGYRIKLDALGLEALSWQAPEVISGWLATPFGPASGNDRELTANDRELTAEENSA